MKAFIQSACVAILLFFIVGAQFAYAGFGVTPPYVRNTSLTRNSVYEQQILLVRGDPNFPLKATVSIDAPGIEDWFEIIEGDEFELPRGEQKIPMTVRVTVPKDAEFKSYVGAIRVKTGAVNDGVSGGAVNISLGAQIDIDLNVIDKVIKDFRVRKINVSNLNEGHKLWWLFFPGKIRFSMMLENTGNVDVSPSSVIFKIYDLSGNVLLEETKNIGKIKKIAPYLTETVTAEIPTRLPAGSYIARYQIMNDDKIQHEGESNLSVLSYGTLDVSGFGFSGLSLAHKISVILPAVSFVALISYSVYRIRERRVKVRSR